MLKRLPNKWALAALGAAGVIALAAILVLSARESSASQAGPDGFDRSNSAFDSAGAQGFDSFALYSLGDDFEGKPLVNITRRNYSFTGEMAPPKGANFVNFIYDSDDCVPTDEGQCPAQLPQVQTWPACVRTLADYSLGPGLGPLPHQTLKLRGVPAARFEDGRIELYTGRVTVVVFNDRLATEETLRAVESLRAANGLAGSVGPGEALPPPAQGAMEGRLGCTAEEAK